MTKLHKLLVISPFVFLCCFSLEEKGSRSLSKGDVYVTNILDGIQGCCIRDNPNKKATTIKRDMQAVVKNFDVYRAIVKLTKQLQKDLNWIVEESKSNRNILDILELLKRDAKGICSTPLPRDCTDLKKQGHKKDGVYRIYPDNKRPVKAYCDMKTNGGGWTVIQRRIDGSTNFQRGWNDYASGFGDVNGEFWFGNNMIHKMTFSRKYELRIELVDTGNKAKYAVYKVFNIGTEESEYQLTVGGYSGNAGDNLAYHNGKKFSTINRDNDEYKDNCASFYGAWWHRSCCYSALNRKFSKTLYWNGGHCKQSTMMIRKL